MLSYLGNKDFLDVDGRKKKEIFIKTNCVDYLIWRRLISNFTPLILRFFYLSFLFQRLTFSLSHSYFFILKSFKILLYKFLATPSTSSTFPFNRFTQSCSHFFLDILFLLFFFRPLVLYFQVFLFFFQVFAFLKVFLKVFLKFLLTIYLFSFCLRLSFVNFALLSFT